MRWRVYLLVSWVLFVIALAPMTCSALSINVSPEWIVANGHDSSIISVNVSTGGPIHPGTVNFSVNDSTLGFVYPNPVSVNTSTGFANTTFSGLSKSGTANISITLNGTTIGNAIVNIDHDIPYSIAVLMYPNNATVGTVGNITLRMQDAHGNIVDSRNNTEYIQFTRTTQDESLLWNRSESKFTNTSITLGNDLGGWVTANISLDTEPGDTLVRITYQYTIDQTIKIERLADGDPWYIYAVRRDPSVPFIPANGEDYCVITYQLFDQYWNVLNNKVIVLNVSPGGESWKPNTTTTYNGLAAVQYGPYSRIFSTNLIATAHDNSSVQSILPVEFYDPNPTRLLLSINPINIPSLDVNSTSMAIITAVVIDSHGKGVGGETVNLAVSDSIYSPINAKVTAGPNITSNSLTTNPNGFAYTNFIPGTFDKNELRSVTGSCTISGSWNYTTKTVTPIWKNYGYLKVTPWVNNSSIIEDQLIDVGVEVYADGPAFTSKPIDMIFCPDRGASMLWDTYDAQKVGLDDKMRYLYNYSSVLVNNLVECPEEEQCDRAGVVSFGPGNNSAEWSTQYIGIDNSSSDDNWYLNNIYPGPYTGYEDYATISTSLTYDFKPSVENDIKSLRPFDPPQLPQPYNEKENVPLRYGLYRAINEMIGLEGTPPRPEAIRAIVVLTDCQWNDWGDPSAGWDGTMVRTELIQKKAPWLIDEKGSHWVPFTTFGKINESGKLWVDSNAPDNDPLQNMANYAKEHDIIIYSIAYPKKNGNIDEGRQPILELLADTTGGMYFECRNGTDLDVIFETIGKDLRQRASVNTTAVFNFTNVKLNDITVSGAETFDYVNSSQSTRTRKWDSTSVLLYDEQRNDTENWTLNQKLIFDLGTMYLHDRWIANFTLKSKKVGTTSLFENSYVNSSTGWQDVAQPVVQTGAIHFGDVPTNSLEITYFNVSDAMHAAYTIEYTGSDVVHAKLYYRKAGDVIGDWKQFATRNYQCKDGQCLPSIQDETLVSKWTLGSGQFMFRIDAWANDAPLDTAYDGPKDIGGRFFIWLR